MATNKSLKEDLKIMGEIRISEGKESSESNNDIGLLKEGEDLLSMDNGSRNNEDEKIITNFNISEPLKDESNVEKKLVKDINIVQNLEESNSKQDDISDMVKGEDLINEEDNCNMKFEILKKYMDLCNEIGLIPSWSELNKFRKYYVG